MCMSVQTDAARAAHEATAEHRITYRILRVTHWRWLVVAVQMVQLDLGLTPPNRVANTNVSKLWSPGGSYRYESAGLIYGHLSPEEASLGDVAVMSRTIAFFWVRNHWVRYPYRLRRPAGHQHASAWCAPTRLVGMEVRMRSHHARVRRAPYKTLHYGAASTWSPPPPPPLCQSDSTPASVFKSKFAAIIND